MDDPFLVVTELLHNGTLLNYLRKTPSIPIDTLIDYGAQVCFKICFLIGVIVTQMTAYAFLV